MPAIKPGEVVKEHQNVLLPILGIVVLVIGLGYYLTRADGGTFLPSTEDELTYEEYPEMLIDQDKDYRAEIITNKGTIKVNLFEEDAPLAVNNMRVLAGDGFYDGLIFHRVMRDFMIQGGDPDGKGTGGPGYTFADELNNGHDYEPGVLAMANSGANTNGSQFFITTSTFKRDVLTSNHTVFGEVTEGMDIVDEISEVETDGSDKPLEDIIIEEIVVDAYYKEN